MLPSFMTNDSKPSTSGLNSALSVFVAGQLTAGSWRAAARALMLENWDDLVSALSAEASLCASFINPRFEVFQSCPSEHALSCGPFVSSATTRSEKGARSRAPFLWSLSYKGCA